MSICKIVSKPEKDVWEWKLSKIIPEKGVIAIAGEKSTGKSSFALDLAVNIASGTQFFGFETEKKNVVYFCYDDVAKLAGQLHKWDNKPFPDETLGFVDVAEYENHDMTDKNVVDEIISIIPDNGVIIIDSVQNATSVNLRAAKGMSSFMAACRRIADSKNCLIVLVMHTGMRAYYHGSVEAALDTKITLERKFDKKANRLWKVMKGNDIIFHNTFKMRYSK